MFQADTISDKAQGAVSMLYRWVFRFYSSEYLQDSSDPVSEKTSFSDKKSQKNDTIGYATLIAPEISSEIKPGMYIFYCVLTWVCTVWRIFIITLVNSATVASRVVLQ